jgi:hypothetical protein
VRQRTKEYSAVAAVAVIALIASVAGIVNDFASDDVPLIVDDARVHSLGAWHAIFAASYWPRPWSAELYRPLSTVLYTIEYAFGAGTPQAFRIVSYLFYASVSVGVLLLARRALWPRCSKPVPLVIALLFAAHPVHVEAVAEAVNQSELVVALLAVAMTVRYIDRRRADGLRRRDWALLLIGYAAAALTKETGLIIPALLVAAELCLIQGIRMRERIRGLWPGYAALGLVGAVVLGLRAIVLRGSVAGTFTAEALMGLGVRGRALTMLQIVPRWFRLLTWPAHLQADYSPKEIVASSAFGGMEALGLVLIIAVIAISYVARRRAPAVTFGVAWCASALLPVSNVLVPTGIVLAERTLFLPSVGFLIAVGGIAEYVLRRVAWPVRATRMLAIASGALVCLGVARSDVRERDWRNNWYLWYRTAQDAPRSYRAQRVFGELLFQLGQREQAVDAYHRATSLSPFPWLIRNELAQQLRDHGDDSTALPELETSLSEKSNQPVARAGLVADLMALGRYHDAIAESDSALADGDSPTVLRGLRALADSAARVGAPPGSVRIRIETAGAPAVGQ